MHTHRAVVRAVLAVAAGASSAHAQSSTPAIFVANEGNLEGSVTSFLVETDGTLAFVDRVITGSRTSTSQPCAGCNTFAIDITPSGRFLATSHARSSPPCGTVMVSATESDASVPTS